MKLEKMGKQLRIMILNFLMQKKENAHLCLFPMASLIMQSQNLIIIIKGEI